MAQILGRVSGHLDGLAGRVFDLEETVSTQLRISVGTHEAAITELQTLDYLRQSLEDLALLIHFLQERCHSDSLNSLLSMEISQKLRLESTRHILGGEIPREFGASASDYGDLDLF